MLRTIKRSRGGRVKTRKGGLSKKVSKGTRLKKGGQPVLPLEYFRKPASKKIIVIGGKKRKTKGGRKLVKRKV
jgi:hypothetical protein